MIDIQKLSKLPQKESRKAYLTHKYGDMWNLKKFDHSWYRSESSDLPDVKARRVIKKFLGKSFDKAFSYFCTLVKIHEQKEFLRLFNDRYWYIAEYIIDNQKRIQLNPNNQKRKKKSVTFTSIDFEVGYYNIISKEITKSFPYYNRDNYIRVILSGYEKTFKSKKDPEYKRLMAEKAKTEKRNLKLVKEQNAKVAELFLSIKDGENKTKIN